MRQIMCIEPFCCGKLPQQKHKGILKLIMLHNRGVIISPPPSKKKNFGASLSEPHTSVYGWTISLYVRTYFCPYAHTAYALMLQIYACYAISCMLACVFKFHMRIQGAALTSMANLSGSKSYHNHIRYIKAAEKANSKI